MRTPIIDLGHTAIALETALANVNARALADDRRFHHYRALERSWVTTWDLAVTLLAFQGLCEGDPRYRRWAAREAARYRDLAAQSYTPSPC